MDSLVFDKDKYKDDKDFWKDISSQMDILTRNDYQIKFRYEDCGIYILEFDKIDQQVAHDALCWIPMDKLTDVSYVLTDEEGENND